MAYQWIITDSEWGVSSRDSTSFTPCPMYLTKGTPVSYGIHFGDEKISKDFNDIIRGSNGHDYIRDTLLTNFNFHAGKHRIEIIFTDINGKKKIFPYSFELPTIDINKLKYNATIVCENLTNADKKEMPSAYIELGKDDE